jgi:hypothetical protein
MIIPFAEWAPDAPDLGDTAREASGLIAEKKGYRPFKALATTSDALTARAQGAAWFRAPDGTTKNFAGDETKLYLLDSSQEWQDVSRSTGGAYATDGTGNWRFQQFVDTAFATNGVDALQSFDLGSGTEWAAASGSPPVGKFICVAHGRFLVLANLASEPQTVAWSGDNNVTTWSSSAVTLADEQDQPDGGEITGLIGGTAPLVLQEAALRLMSFEGSPTVFRFDVIARDLGNSVPNAAAGWGSLAFFCHRSGFHMVVGGQQITPIGRDRVDRWFWGMLDQVNMFRCSSAIDPVNSLYMLAFPTGSDGTPAEILIYNWKADRWSHVPVSCEMIYSGATQQSWTLEDLDVFGTVEDVPYSLDSSYWTGVRQLLLAGFSTDHKSGTFSGANVAYQINTQEMQFLPGRRARLLRARPLTDGGSPQLAVGTRSTQQATVNWSSARSMVPDGSVPLNSEGRYHRLRQTQTAGATLQWLQGIEIDEQDIKLGARR